MGVIFDRMRTDFLDRAIKESGDCGRVARELAIENGNQDEVCKLCLRVFLAHESVSKIDCDREGGCHYDPPPSGLS